MGNAGKAMFPTPWKIHELFTITHYVDWLIVPSTTTFNVEPILFSREYQIFKF